jgi:hypothetical protein
MGPRNILQQQLPKGIVEGHGCSRMVCDHISEILA